MKKILLINAFALMGMASPAFSQITVQSDQSPQQLVQGVLLGSGVVATNITYNGSPVMAQSPQSNVTYFDAQTTVFPIGRGVLLTTGQGIAAIGPNTSTSFAQGGTPLVSGDADLNAIANGNVTNGAILEFDFVPQGDSLSFRYVFASDEYPEFSPSSFNDAFGFFLSGPGLSGPYTNGAVNIALIPGTTIPVTINNVGDVSNTQYYVDNPNGSVYGAAIQYDGTTTVLKALAQVQCGETYHIKLAICNVGDQGYDSGVFLEAESFTSPAIEVSFGTNGVSSGGDTVLYEGCNSYDIFFVRPTADSILTVTYEISGTAVPADYSPLANPITFAVDQDSVILNVSAIADGITETTETITFTVYTVTICGDTLVSTGTLYIYDFPPDMDLNVQDSVLSQCFDTPVELSATMTGGFPGYTYEWTSIPSGTVVGTGPNPVVFSPTSNGFYEYAVEATDMCGVTFFYDTVVMQVNQTLSIDSLIAQNATACNPDGYVAVAFPNGISGVTGPGQPFNHWTGPGNPGPLNIDGTVMTDVPSGWYYFTITDAVCSDMDSVFVGQDNPPIADFTATPMTGTYPLNVSFTNNSQNATVFDWSFGNGNFNFNTGMENQSQTYDTTGFYTVQLIAYQGDCTDTMTVTIIVTDPPVPPIIPPVFPPVVEVVPNIFTPNNDGENDFFELVTTNADHIEMVIVNRWGNVMFERSGLPVKWDGKAQSGQMADDGVYFVSYKVTGDGITIEGQTFVQLVR